MAVAPVSILSTDGWQGQVPLRDRYDQRPDGQASHIHRVFSNFETWLEGTHHGVGPEHLPHDIDAFVVRFNRCNSLMAAFQSLLGLTGEHQPNTDKMLHAAELTGEASAFVKDWLPPRGAAVPHPVAA